MVAFPASFFEALGRDGGPAAMQVLRGAAFESGLEQESSPRAQPFFSDGDWESARTMVTLSMIDR